MRPLAFAALLVLSGCTPMQWVRQDATPAQLEQDLAQCRQEAWREAQWRAFMYRPFGPTYIVDRFGQPRFFSYSPLGGPFGDTFIEESRLAHFCMRAKGYDLAPIEPDTAAKP
jgi:hypothetical protein